MLQLPLPRDVIRYIISDYLPWDELVALCESVSHLQLNAVRTRIFTYTRDEHLDKNKQWPNDRPPLNIPVRTVCTYVDNKKSLINVTKYWGEVKTSECNYDVHVLKHGTQREWNYTGTISEIKNYRHGGMHGTQCEYYYSGRLLSVWFYNAMSIAELEWHENGHPSYIKHFLNDQVHGLECAWRDDATLCEVRNWMHGKIVHEYIAPN